jgi:hypothetical protein
MEQTTAIIVSIQLIPECSWEKKREKELQMFK